MEFNFFNTKEVADRHITPGGLRYDWYYKPRSRRRAPRSELSIPCGIPLEFSVHEEGFLTFIAKKLGFATEFQTHDSEFDKRFYILSDDPALCSKFKTQIIRESIIKIFGSGAKDFEVKAGRCIAHMKNASPAPDPLYADGIAESMYAMLEEFRKITLNPQAIDKAMAAQSRVAITSFFIMLLIGAVAVVINPYTLASYKAFLHSAGLYAMPVIIAMIIVVRSQFSGSSRGMKVMLYAIVAGIPAICLLSYAGHYYSNIYFDKTPAETRYARILGISSTRHKNRTSYHIQIENWTRGDTNINLDVPYATYNKAKVNGAMLIKTHPGYLNVGWIESYELY